MIDFSQKIVQEALTFDDVLLVPAYSNILPREVEVKSKISKNVTLNIPIVSAAMDTVTESRLAIAIAREGGLGFIHKNMTIEAQAKKVRQVKRAESGLIIDPITLKKDSTIGETLQLMKENKIGGIPVIDDVGLLIGIITNRDLRFQENLTLKVSDLMTSENLITAPEGTDLAQAEEILKGNKIEKLPIVDKNGKLTGLITYKDILRVTNYPNANKDQYGRLIVGAALGVTGDVMERVAALVEMGVDIVTVDTAHGHSQGVLDTVKKIKDLYGDQIDVVGGNIATGAAAVALAEAGADGVKVGIGPGSICTTRIVTGCGVPQLTAVMNVKAGLQEKFPDVAVIADGGIRYSGDIVKAVIAGADCIMAGSLFAGVEEAPGETIILEGRKFKGYRGMGSLESMEKGSKDRYFQDVEDDVKKLVPEGITGRVPYKGHLSEVMTQYVGGLRAGLGYAGCRNVKEMQEKAQLVKITSASMAESHPHNITITREAPNYSRRS
jgi:IMP dehydrogenase